MASLIPGYEYDIFISYRQKDNKHDGWVTEFVDNLKGELESTFKEDVSVYFDINPHNGLLETHDVNASLKEKLKCLIFIPIISQTYCDSKSFAWQHEFVAFNKMSKEDQFGRDIHLAGGNVASRILPVKIHDLDPEDKTLLEHELGGFIRGIDFIYKEPGVNRPLKPEDDEKKNLNGTKYLNQINKVANAIKEIIIALRKHNKQEGEVPREVYKTSIERRKKINPKIIIASAIILVLAILGSFFIPRLFKPSAQIEKSIAVLPFINDSPNDSTTYFINGIMEEILNNLQKIKDFRVLSRTSTDQYTGTDRPTLPEIARKLKVNYIVEGSGQKYGNKFVLRVQLIVANNERHIWGKSYDREIRQTSDIINIQSEVAQMIAEELKATITPEEKVLIEKTPTTNLTAYDFYQRGREEHLNYWIDHNNLSALKKAESFYRKALDYDSSFALTYAGLALVYRDKILTGSSDFVTDLDSILILANKALSNDNQLSEAYYARASYYFARGNRDQTEKELDKALKFNPNYWQIYADKASFIYLWDNDQLDFVKGIENIMKAASINRGKELPELLRKVGSAYGSFAGFDEKAIYYFKEAFKLDNDSVLYLKRLADEEYLKEDFKKAVEIYKEALAIDTNDIDIILGLGQQYMFLGQYKESFIYFRKCVEQLKSVGSLPQVSRHRIGYVFWQNGLKKEASYWLNEQKRISEKSIKFNDFAAKSFSAYYDLAGVLAFKGEKEQAIKNLRIISQMPVFPKWWITLIKNDPLFISIRNEPEFQQIVNDFEAKYEAEHERVRKWLEKTGQL